MRKDGAIKMIRNITLRTGGLRLLVLMALNAYLAMNRLTQIQKSAALTLFSSRFRADLSAGVARFDRLESAQRGYLLAGNSTTSSLHQWEEPDGTDLSGLAIPAVALRPFRIPLFLCFERLEATAHSRIRPANF